MFLSIIIVFQVTNDDFIQNIMKTPLNNENNENDSKPYKNDKKSDSNLAYIPESIKNWLNTTTEKLPSKGEITNIILYNICLLISKKVQSVNYILFQI